MPAVKDQRPPAYSTSITHQTQDSGTPGPSDYDIPTTMGPEVPDKHTSGAFSMTDRNEMTAKESSPGPAEYDATDPNTYKNRSPNYSISTKLIDLSDESQIPAPNEYDPKLCIKEGCSFGIKTDAAPYITAEDNTPYVNK